MEPEARLEYDGTYSTRNDVFIQEVFPMCSPDVMVKVNSVLRRGGQPVTRRRFLGSAGAVAAAGALAPLAMRAQGATPIATPVNGDRSIGYAFVADLSHALSPTSPVWPGRLKFGMETDTTVADAGFFASILTLHEHVGTHMDAPAHFFEDGLSADLIDPARLVGPLVVLDVTEQAAGNEDYAVTPDDILLWEGAYGQLPAGAFVAMNAGWSGRFSDAEAFVNADAEGVMHFPGFHPDAASFLVEERNIVGIGVDSLSLDPGNSTDFGTHITILGAGLYGIEGVANLGEVPASGATVIVGGPNHEGASGGLARLLVLY